MNVWNCYLGCCVKEKLITQPKYVRDPRTRDAKYPYEFEASGTHVNVWELLKERLEKTDDLFCFTYAKHQVGVVEDMLENFGLKDYLILHSPMVLNPNYKSDGPRVATFILKGKHRVEKAETDSGV